MRNGQNKRMRGRNRKSHNPMARVYESNGPDVKIRGNPSHIAEKYMQLARDAQSSGDPVAAENYFQHAEHYYRLIAAAQEQFRQNNPHFARPESPMPGARDDAFDEGEDDGQPPRMGEEPYGTGEQPYLPRDAQPYPQHQQPQQHQPRHQGGAPAEGGGDVDRLPSFITGGQAPQHHQGNQGHGNQGHGNQGHGQNGHDNQPDRFPLHRRRRRHRGGPRHDMQGGGSHQGPGGDTDESPPRE
jgi:hypothetical protein